MKCLVKSIQLALEFRMIYIQSDAKVVSFFIDLELKVGILHHMETSYDLLERRFNDVP